MSTFGITLHVYDLSKGLASGLSGALLGTSIEGIWHTGVVIYGYEYYFGGGIQRIKPLQFLRRHGLNAVTKKHNLGITNISQEDFEEFLTTISHKYTSGTYNLFQNNCNNFSNEIVKFLKGILDPNAHGIPRYILDLPRKVLSTPFGQSVIGPMYQQMQSSNEDDNFIRRRQQQSRANTSRRSSPFSFALKILHDKYTKDIVTYFERMETKIAEKPKVVPFTSITVAKDTDDITSLRDTVSTVILIYSSSKNQHIVEDIKSDYEVDIDSVESFEELFEVTTAFIDMAEDGKCLLVNHTGNNEALAIALCHQLVDSEENNFDVLKCLLQLGTSYISYEHMIELFKFVDDQEKLKMVNDLHKESPQNVISQTLLKPIDKILGLDLKIPRDQIRTVLKTTKGDVDAAMTLLLQ